jgi:hypothetical protein
MVVTAKDQKDFMTRAGFMETRFELLCQRAIRTKNVTAPKRLVWGFDFCIGTIQNRTIGISVLCTSYVVD